MIETAVVLPGSETPAGDGVTGAMRCTILLEDGRRRAAVLKRGSLGEVAAEAFSAALLRAWGLPVPDPFLVDEAAGPAFASADAGYPSLKQRIGLSGEIDAERRALVEVLGCRIVATLLRTAPLAAAADEAIDNRDRNLGNILWDGADEAWIDHAFALGQGVGMRDVNKLCLMAMVSENTKPFSSSAVAQALTLDRSSADLVTKKLPAVLCAHELAEVVSARVATVASRLLARFPAPDDLLSMA